MKCDELNAHYISTRSGNSCCCYFKSDVDAAIAELKQKLQDQCISCPVKMQEDDVVAEKDNEIRRLKRELWLTRGAVHKAKRLAMYGLLQAYPLWEGTPAGKEVHKKIFRYDGYERKCRAKAEEYK